MLGTAPLSVRLRLCLIGAGLIARLLPARLQPECSLTAYAAATMQQRSIQSFFTQPSAGASSKLPAAASSTIASTATLAGSGTASSHSTSASVPPLSSNELPRVSDVVIDSQLTVSAIDVAPADDALAVSSTATTAPSSPSSASASPSSSSSSSAVPTSTAASLNSSSSGRSLLGLDGVPVFPAGPVVGGAPALRVPQAVLRASVRVAAVRLLAVDDLPACSTDLRGLPADAVRARERGGPGAGPVP